MSDKLSIDEVTATAGGESVAKGRNNMAPNVQRPPAVLKCRMRIVSMPSQVTSVTIFSRRSKPMVSVIDGVQIIRTSLLPIGPETIVAARDDSCAPPRRGEGVFKISSQR